ncbi:50S ribosomal protein L23 [Bacillus cereus]
MDVKSNKTEVKDALEAIFGVKVEKSEHHELQAESKARWSSRWFTSRRRKAIVKLTADNKEIEIFQGV